MRRMPVVEFVSRFTSVDGVRIHDRSAGRGSPLVFVHGLAVSGRYFEPTIAALADHYEGIAVDLPGFGRSDDPDGVLGVAGLADALADWLRATDRTTAPLIGNSAGCQYIVDCVTRHPDITGPLVLIGPTTDPAARTAAAQVGRFLRTGRHADIAQLPVLLDDCRAAGLHRVVATFRSILDDAVEDKLPAVRQDVLVLRGASDPLVPRRWAAQVAWLVPRGRLVEVPGAHVVHASKPDQVAAVITAFLNGPALSPETPKQRSTS